MREDDLLSHVYRRSSDLERAFPWVEAGPGDDCAVVRVGQSRVLMKTDQLVEGRHFVPGTPVAMFARKAVTRPLSDLAAAAGRPIAALAAAVLPPAWRGGRANEVFDALSSVARGFGCPLVGGDIAMTELGPLVLTISIVGEPHAARGPVTRRGALPGDGLYVTGRIGGSFGEGGLGRHLAFEPRLAEAAALADVLGGRLHAMMDLSDGLGIDAGRLAKASGVRIEVDAGAIPLAPEVQGVERAIRDGEDYELLFTAEGEVPGVLAGTCVTRIGRVVAGSGAVLVTGSGMVEISGQGWDHGAR
ncbi:MAG: thiamine-phosphate kinase [Leptolyngbya sp. PLA1]|nr:thiamine-phosphate kinase [Leptolyngbya sp. PLA1]